MSFPELKKLINHYSRSYKRFGDLRIYKTAIEYLGSHAEADRFMLSDEYGGYDKSSLNRIKYLLVYEKTRPRK